MKEMANEVGAPTDALGLPCIRLDSRFIRIGAMLLCFLLVTEWQPRTVLGQAVVPAGAGSTTINADNEEQLIAGFTNPSVQEIILRQDIKFTPSKWPSMGAISSL